MQEHLRKMQLYIWALWRESNLRFRCSALTNCVAVCRVQLSSSNHKFLCIWYKRIWARQRSTKTKAYLTIFAVCTLSCAYWVGRHWWLFNVSSHVSLFMNTDPNSCPDPEKNSETWNYIPSLSFCFVRNEVHNEFCFVVNEGRRTKTGYGFMSRCFVLIRVRIWVRIHKQLGMNL
jgi:hypothetical protein